MYLTSSLVRVEIPCRYAPPVLYPFHTVGPPPPPLYSTNLTCVLSRLVLPLIYLPPLALTHTPLSILTIHPPVTATPPLPLPFPTLPQHYQSLPKCHFPPSRLSAQLLTLSSPQAHTQDSLLKHSNSGKFSRPNPPSCRTRNPFAPRVSRHPPPFQSRTTHSLDREPLHYMPHIIRSSRWRGPKQSYCALTCSIPQDTSRSPPLKPLLTPSRPLPPPPTPVLPSNVPPRTQATLNCSALYQPNITVLGNAPPSHPH